MTYLKYTRSAVYLFLLFLIMMLPVSRGSRDVFAEENRHAFSTWEGFEVDKCASIWLIKRFIDTNAVITFFPKGEIIQEGVLFDVPEARFRRYHNMSTFESLLKHYKLEDRKIHYLGKIIHDIEVNIWERKLLEETLTVQSRVNEIIRTSLDRNEIIKKTLDYFDDLYLHIADDRDEKL